jgi:type IV secretion system protein VirB9
MINPVSIRLLASCAFLPLIAATPATGVAMQGAGSLDASTALPQLSMPAKSASQRQDHHSSTRIERSVHVATYAATQEPTLHGYLNAIQVYPFTEGMIYRVYAAPEQVTDLTLQAGEVLGSVAAGDTVRWIIGDTPSGSGNNKRTHILIKPIAAGLSTNLVIATDRRSYHVSLTSTATTAMSAVSWTYPSDPLIALKAPEVGPAGPSAVAGGLSVDQLEFGYAISGDNPSWRPIRAFDDGRQTFIEFPASIAVDEAPPLFILGAGGETQLVNYRVRGRFYVVDRLFAAAELRLGTKHQEVVRITRQAGNPSHAHTRRAA